MKCNDSEFINETQDVDRFVVAKQAKEDVKRLKQSVNRAMRTGSYALPENRINRYVDSPADLEGKMLTLESIDGNTFEDVKVENVEITGFTTVKINNEYNVNLANNMTTNGSYMVTLGSEESGVAGRRVKALDQISGTVNSDLDVLMQKMEEYDGKPASGRIKQVVEMYKNALLASSKQVKLDVEIMQDLDNKRTLGKADPEMAKIQLVKGNTRYASHAEIMAHELQHVLIHNTIKTSPVLKRKIEELRVLVRKHVEWDVFLPTGVTKETANDMDIEYAKMMHTYTMYNSKSEVALDEFMTAATTNEKLMDKLELVKEMEYELVPYAEIKPGEKARFKGLWNKIAKLINSLYRANITQGKNAREMAIDLLDTALEMGYKEQKRQDKSIYDKALEKIDELDDRISKIGESQQKEYNTFADSIKQRDNNKVRIAIDAVWNIRGMAKVKSAMLRNAVFSSVTRDMSDKNIAKFYKMFRHAKAFVENAVAPIKTTTMEVLDKDYKLGEIAKSSRRAMKRVILDTDSKVLGGSDKLAEYLRDESRIDAELDEFASKYDKEVVEAVNELAKLMVHNKATKRNVYTNVEQIALDYLGMTEGKEVEYLDKMATLVALKESAEVDKRLTLEVLDAEEDGKYVYRDGVDHAVELVKAEEEQLIKQAYAGNKIYRQKGAKQEKFEKDRKYYIVEADEVRDLVKAKMHNLGKHEDLSSALGKDVYIMVGENVEATYTEGLMSKVQLKTEGDSLKRLLMEMNLLTEEEAEDRIDEIKMGQKGTSDQALIPERSGLNEVYDYKVRIPYVDKVQHMNMEDDMIQTVGETVANLSHKQEAMVNNRAAVIYFKNFYGKEKANKKYKFVEISAESENAKMKQYWDEMPYYLKKEIEKQMGGKLMVEESLLVDFFGYKDVSIVDLPVLRNSKRRQMIAKKIEDVIKDFVRMWKQEIVAKTPGTIVGNTTSNMVIALQHTESKNPAKYLQRFQSMWKAMNEYQELKKKKAKLEIKKTAGEQIKNLDRDIADLQARMENNPVYPIMQDGQYSVILEDINREWMDDRGIIDEKLDELLRKGDKLKLKEIVDFMYVRKDSKMHDSVMKLTTYADAINKIVVYEDIKQEFEKAGADKKHKTFVGRLMKLQKGEKYNGREVEQEMLNYVDQLHVNYGYLDNRWIKYANDLDFLSFTKYFFRVFPAMVKMLSKKGMTTLFTEGAQELSGIGSVTPWQDIYDPLSTIDRKLMGILDPGNMFEHIVTLPVAR